MSGQGSFLGIRKDRQGKKGNAGLAGKNFGFFVLEKF